MHQTTLAWISYEPYPPTNQTLVDVAFNFDFDSDFDFDHYQHLNKEGDYICLVETVEMFGLLEIKDVFKPYDFWLVEGGNPKDPTKIRFLSIKETTPVSQIKTISQREKPYLSLIKGNF